MRSADQVNDFILVKNKCDEVVDLSQDSWICWFMNYLPFWREKVKQQIENDDRDKMWKKKEKEKEKEKANTNRKLSKSETKNETKSTD